MSDSDLEIIEEVPKKDKYHQWRPLQEYLREQFRIKLPERHKNVRTSEEKYKLTNKYLDSWIITKFSYESMKQLFFDHFQSVEQKLTKNDKLNQTLWKKLKEASEKGRVVNISLSWLVDRTSEHFKSQYGKRGENATFSSPEYQPTPAAVPGSSQGSAPPQPAPPPGPPPSLPPAPPPSLPAGPPPLPQSYPGLQGYPIAQPTTNTFNPANQPHNYPPPVAGYHAGYPALEQVPPPPPPDRSLMTTAPPQSEPLRYQTTHQTHPDYTSTPPKQYNPAWPAQSAQSSPVPGPSSFNSPTRPAYHSSGPQQAYYTPSPTRPLYHSPSPQQSFHTPPQTRPPYNSPGPAQPAYYSPGASSFSTPTPYYSPGQPVKTESSHQKNRFPMNARGFKFTSFSNQLEKIPGHVLGSSRHRLIDPANYSVVAVEMEVVGDGLLCNDVMQIGLSFPDTPKILLAGKAEKVEISKQILENNYKDGKLLRREWNTEEKVSVYSQRKLIHEFVHRLDTRSGQQDTDGFVLVVLHMETLIELVKQVVVQQMDTDFHRYVKGYIVLEPVIRQKCLSGLDGPVVRISSMIAAELFNLPPSKYSDQRAAHILRMFNQLKDLDSLSAHFFQINLEMIKKFKNFVKSLQDLADIASEASCRLKAVAKLSAVVDPFPRERDLCRPREELICLLIHILVFNNIDLRWLETMAAEMDHNSFEERLNSAVDIELKDMVDDDFRMLRAATNALVSIVKSRLVNRGDSSRLRFRSGSTDSEGSMPEERRVSPFKDSRIQELQNFLVQTFERRAGNKYSHANYLAITSSMCKLLLEHFQDFSRLQNVFTGPRNPDVHNAYNSISRRMASFEKEWREFTLENLFETTEMFFNPPGNKYQPNVVQPDVQFRDEKFVGLENQMGPAITRHFNLNLGEAKKTARHLIFALESINCNYQSLQRRIPAGGGNENLIKSRLEHDLKKNFGDREPPEWRGVKINFIVDQVYEYFSSQPAGSASPGNFSPSGPRNNRKRSLSSSRRDDQPGFGTGGTVNTPRPGGFGFGKRARISYQDDDGWSELIQGLEKEMNALNGFCEKKKSQHEVLKNKPSKEIITDMAKYVEEGQLNLKVVRTRMNMKKGEAKNTEVKKLTDEIFSREKRELFRNKKGGNQAVIDRTSWHPFHKTLFLRFCDYLKNPETIKEDYTKEMETEAPVEQGPRPLNINDIQKIVTLLQARHSKYLNSCLNLCRKNRTRGEALVKRLHEYLYYSQHFLKLNLNAKRQIEITAEKVKDLVIHILGFTDLENLRDEVFRKLSVTTSRKQALKEIGVVVKSTKFPPLCQPIHGLLVSLITDFFDQLRRGQGVSDQVKSVRMKTDDSNALTELQEYLFHVYLQEAVNMETEGSLRGFTLDRVDVDQLSSSVQKTVNFLLDCGFELYAAIDNYIKGTLSESLSKLIKPHASSSPEGSHTKLWIRILVDFIDTKLKTFKPMMLPLAKIHRTALKNRIVSMIKNGTFIKPEQKENICVNISIPLVELESLSSIPESDVTVKEEEEVVTPAVNSRPGELVEVKDEDCWSRDRVPGNVTTSKVLIIPPRSRKTFYAPVTGLPGVKSKCELLLQLSQEAKDKGLKLTNNIQMTTLENDMTVQVELNNPSESDVVTLQTDFNVATAKIKDPTDIISDSPGFVLQFIRHYYKTEGLENIKLQGCYFFFGSSQEMKIDKDRRTNFKMFGTNYSCGVQDYYTVEAVVYFLNQVDNLNEGYEDYLRVALNYNKQVVREVDFVNMFKYLHGEIAICNEIDKHFTEIDNKKLNYLFLQSSKWDSDFNLPCIKSQLKEDMKIKLEDEIEPTHDEEDNPNRKVVSELREVVVQDWNIPLEQSGNIIELLVRTLADLELSMTQIRVDYFGVPKHRHVYQQVMGERVLKKLGEDGLRMERIRETYEKNMRLTIAAFRHREPPSKISDVLKLLTFLKLIKDDIPAAENQTNTGDVITMLESTTVDKSPSSSITLTGEKLKGFWNLMERVGSMLSCRPATDTGKIVIYTAVGEASLGNLVVQEQAEDTEVVLGFNSRILTPEERRLSRPEREIVAAVWSVKTNVANLLNEDFILKTSSQTVTQVFSETDEMTAKWREELKEFTFTPRTIRDIKNPAACLTTLDWTDVEEIPVDSTGLVKSLFIEMLNIMKREAKNRLKWIKNRMWKEKQCIADSGDQFNGELIEHLPQDSRQECGPGSDFITAASATQQGDGEVGESSTKLPQFPVESFQPLFEAFFTDALKTEPNRKTAEELSSKIFTTLHVHSVSYAKLEEIFVELTNSGNNEVVISDAQTAVKRFFDSLSLGKLKGLEDLVRVTVDHFFNALKIRPRIHLNTRTPLTEVAVEQNTSADEGRPAKENNVEPMDTSLTGNDWYLDLLQDMEDERVEVGWTVEAPVPPPREVNTKSSGSLEDLMDFYDKMIQRLDTSELAWYKSRGIDCSSFKINWTIAGETFDSLESVFKRNINDLGQVSLIYHKKLEAYKNILVKNVSVDQLIDWTIAFFSLQHNTNQGSQQLVNQKNQLGKMQKDAVSIEEFENLQSFLKTCMTVVHDKSVSAAGKIAAECIQTFALVGLQAADVGDLFTAGGMISSCTQGLYNRMIKILENVSCLLSPLLDAKRLVKYTLVFYRTELILKELSRSTGTTETSSVSEGGSLSSLVESARVSLAREMNRPGALTVGTISIAEKIQVEPGDLKEATGKIVVTFKDPLPENTQILVKGNESLSCGPVKLYEQESRYTGDSIDICFSNTDEEKAASVGHIARSTEVGVVLLDGFTEEKMKSACAEFGVLLSQCGLDRRNLVQLCNDVVEGTKGVSPLVLIEALIHAMKNIVRNRAQKLNMFMFQKFIKHLILIALKEKTANSLVKVEETEKEEGEVDQEDADEEDVGKVLDKLIKKYQAESSETLAFPAQDIKTEDLVNPPVKQVEEVDIWALLKNHYMSMDLNNMIDGKVLAGQYLVDSSKEIEINLNEEEEEVKYNLDTIVLFLRFGQSSYPMYVKKVNAQFPGSKLVMKDHRIKLLDFIEEPDEELLELEVFTKDALMCRLYARYKHLTGEILDPEAIPKSKFQEFQPLYSKYFLAMYRSSLRCQVNWLEVCRVAAEELVHTWVTAKYNNLETLVHKQRKANRLKKESKRKKKYQEIFMFHQDNLREVSFKISQTMDIRIFIRVTMEYIDEILANQRIGEEQQRMEERMEVLSDSEEEDNELINNLKGIEDYVDDISKDTEDVDNHERMEASDSEDEDNQIIEKLKEVNQEKDLDQLDHDELKEKEKALKQALSETESNLAETGGESPEYDAEAGGESPEYDAEAGGDSPEYNAEVGGNSPEYNADAGAESSEFYADAKGESPEHTAAKVGGASPARTADSGGDSPEYNAESGSESDYAPEPGTYSPMSDDPSRSQDWRQSNFPAEEEPEENED